MVYRRCFEFISKLFFHNSEPDFQKSSRLNAASKVKIPLPRQSSPKSSKINLVKLIFLSKYIKMANPTIKTFSPLENTPENNRNIPPKIQKSNQNPRVASTASPTITIQESMTMSQNDQSQNNGQLGNDNNQNHTQSLVIGLDKALSHRTRSLATNATIGGNSHTHDIEVIGFDDHELLSHESKSGLVQVNSSTVEAVPIPIVPTG